MRIELLAFWLCLRLAFASDMRHVEVRASLPMTSNRQKQYAASVGSKILFAGSPSSRVDIFDAATGAFAPTALRLSQAREGMAAVSVRTLAMFAGGYSTPSSPVSTVDIFDIETGAHTVAAVSQPRSDFAAAASGAIAMFTSGCYVTAETPSCLLDLVDIFNADTKSWSTATLSLKRNGVAGAACGDLFVFAGGYIPPSAAGISTVDVFNVSSELWSVQALRYPRGFLTAVGLAEYFLFAGGVADSSYCDIVEMWNTYTGAWTAVSLGTTRASTFASVLGSMALLAGDSDPTVNVFQAQDASWTTTSLSEMQMVYVSASIPGAVLFGSISTYLFVDFYLDCTVVSCPPCNAGHYPPVGAICGPCLQGSYSFANETECTTCLPGLIALFRCLVDVCVFRLVLSIQRND